MTEHSTVIAEDARKFVSIVRLQVFSSDGVDLPHGGIHSKIIPETPPNFLASPLNELHISEMRLDFSKMSHGHALEAFDNYSEYLNVFNGCALLRAGFFLYGLRAPKEINVRDFGFYPSDLLQANYHERTNAFPMDELIIGGSWEPDLVFSILGSQFIMRKQDDKREIVGKHDTLCDLWNHMLQFQSDR